MTSSISPIRPWVHTLFVALGALTVGVTLLALDPFLDGSILPPCPFHAISGLYCPGCGTTRALHALLHGNIPLALSMNPLTIVAVVLMPVLLWNSLNPGRMRMARVSDARIWLAVVVAFFVLRNLPWEPFVNLAPS